MNENEGALLFGYNTNNHLQGHLHLAVLLNMVRYCWSGM